MLRIKALLTISLSLFLAACITQTTKKTSKNPIIGTWSSSTSCQNSIKLQKNYQIQGSTFGNWEERPHIVELNLAKNIKGQRKYVQVLLTKPNQKKMQILRIIYPFEKWEWNYKSGDIIKKCS